MTPPPCLCKVDCGAQQGFSPFLLLSVAAALIAFVIAIATAPKQTQSNVLHTTERKKSTSRSSSDRSSDKDDSNSDGDNDSDGNSNRGRWNNSTEQLRTDVEIRLAAFLRDQEATPQEFQANNYRQRRILADRSTAESGRLTAAIEDLRRRIVDHQADLRDANRAIQDLRSRGTHTPKGSPSPRRMPHPPSPPRIPERSTTPSAPRVVFQHLSGVARPARENPATANIAPIFSRDCESRARR